MISILSVLFVTIITTTLATSNEDAEILFQKYFEWKIVKVSPEYTILRGYHDYLDGTEMNNMSLPFVQEVSKECRQFADEAEKLIGRKDICPREKHFLKILRHECHACMAATKHQGHLLAPVDHVVGIQMRLQKVFSQENGLPVRTIRDFENNLIRLSKIPQQLRDVQTLLKEGVKQKITLSKAVIENAEDSFKKLQVKDPVKSVFYTKFGKIKEYIPDASNEDVKRIQKYATCTIEKVLKAFKTLEDYIFTEYYNHAKPHPGFLHYPNGKEMYRSLVRHFTTLTNITPEEIYKKGLTDIKKLQNDTVEIAKELGFGNLNFTDIAAKIDSYPMAIFKNETKYMISLRKAAEKIAPTLHKAYDKKLLTPEIMNLEVKRTKGPLSLWYEEGSWDNKIKGFVNVNPDLYMFPRMSIIDVVLHEGNPGHHFQFVANRGNFIPEFLQKVPFHFLGWGGKPPQIGYYFSFIEGMAGYAEYIGYTTLGVFDEDPYQKFGYMFTMLSIAARQVVDVGLHYFGWSVNKCNEFFCQNLMMDTTQDCPDNTFRHDFWPGQTLTYNTNLDYLLKFRALKEQEPNFDLKKFHSVLLKCMGPMELLSDCYDLLTEEGNIAV